MHETVDQNKMSAETQGSSNRISYTNPSKRNRIKIQNQTNFASIKKGVPQ
jgi:hypothetical protein